jgi:NAD-dependent histone deacetylase SIR2
LGDLTDADLLIVIGTSLQVQPFASLTYFVPRSCPRVLINLEQAGDLGTRQDDVLLLGKCDDIVKDLATELGWLKELKAAWAETRTTLDDPPPMDEPEEEPEAPVPKVEETEEERLQREIAWLTKSVDETLKVTDNLKERVEKEVKEEAKEEDVKEVKEVHPPSPVQEVEAGSSQESGPNL